MARWAVRLARWKGSQVGLGSRDREGENGTEGGEGRRDEEAGL